MRLASILLCIAAPLASLGQASTAPSLLAAMRDHDRPVLLFAGPDDARVQEEYAALQGHAEELRERQMRIVLVTRSPTRADANTPPGTVAATDAEAKALRSRFHVAANQFTVVLLGKDGGEKFRWPQPVPFETLRALVDAMPMRRQEMRLR